MSLSPFRPLMFALAIMAAPATAQQIEFPQKNVSDVRGLLNVFHAFRAACLDQPVTPDLPARLAPEGYKVVSRQAHYWGEADDGDGPMRDAVLTRTGSEEQDWAEGAVIVDFGMPTEDKPEGDCRVTWHRAWDYDTGQDRIAFGMYGAFDSHVSYYLEAILRTRPQESLLVDPPHSGVSDWITFCWEGRMCAFKVLYNFDAARGIEISIDRFAVRN